MAKLQSGTRIYGTANVDTSVYVGTSNNTTGTGGVTANVTTILIGNNTINTSLNTTGLSINAATIANTTGVYTGIVNAASHTVGTNTIANSTGVYTGVANAATLSVGTSFIANTSRATISTIPLYANGGAGTSGHVLTSNGSTGSPYWAVAVPSGDLFLGAMLLGGM